MAIPHQHPARPKHEARAPLQHPTPEPRTQVRSQSPIRWRTVAVAGGIAWLVVICFTLAVWAVGHGHAAAKGRMLAAITAAGEEVRIGAKPEFPADKSLEPALPPEAERSSPVISFRKAPACPRLPDGEEEGVNPTPVLPVSEQGLGGMPVDFQRHGTQVAFASSPSEAARQAAKDRKLLFVLHLSGNFEDAKFT